MHTGNFILIRVPRETVFATVSDLARWPTILPHYRYVRFTGGKGVRRVVEMSATRSGIPISWTSEFWTDERRLELHFVHLKKWTKGMKVVWNLTPTRDGTRIEIVHDLQFRISTLAWLAEPIISNFFIHQVASNTLKAFKDYLESADGKLTSLKPS